jgi:hypothetical protein
VIVAFGLAVLTHLVPALPGWVTELFLAMLSAVTVHLIDRLWLFRDTEESLQNLKADIQSAVSDRMGELNRESTALTRNSLELIETGIERTIASQTRSLDAMTRSGIVRLYPSRAEAAEDLHHDMIDEVTSKIHIIGISLNDFALAQEPRLGEAWEKLRLYVQDGYSQNSRAHNLDIRILLIDPHSHGARLRSLAQIRKKDPMPGHLEDDVKAISEVIQELVRLSKRNSATTGVTFQCHLYRLPPILFLCLTDSVCYVQQYHFWSKRERSTPIPVLKYRREVEAGQLYQMHAEMEAHFDWIWDKASIDITQFSEQGALGIEAGMYQSSAVNVYMNPKNALDRMLFLLSHAKERVAIQGISLLSFCKTGDLLQALTSLIEGGEVKIRMLFIDPECEQARFRSYREERFGHSNLPWDRYQQIDSFHQSSDLFKDTNRAIQRLGDMARSAAREAAPEWQLKLEIGLYRSAPHCFILQVDDSILVEQYHYGKIIPYPNKGTAAILGKDMPVVEYVNRSPDLYAEMPLRRPFSLLTDHFEFAWELARKINVIDDEPLSAAAAAGRR